MSTALEVNEKLQVVFQKSVLDTGGGVLLCTRTQEAGGILRRQLLHGNNSSMIEILIQTKMVRLFGGLILHQIVARWKRKCKKLRSDPLEPSPSSDITKLIKDFKKCKALLKPVVAPSPNSLNTQPVKNCNPRIQEPHLLNGLAFLSVPSGG